MDSFICINCGTKLKKHPAAWNCKACRKNYPITREVPYFLPEIDNDQSRTAEAFSYKWETINRRSFDKGLLKIMKEFHAERFGLQTPEDFQALMGGKVVLDAGIGSGEAENYFADYPAMLYGVDISEAIHIAEQHWGNRSNFRALRGDVLRLPFADDFFDVIWSDGVLHHTPDTRKALSSCVRVLKPDGLIVFYVYLKKSPVREFTDDHIRTSLAPLTPSEAFEALKPLTVLARDLSRLAIHVRLDQDLPYLGIKAGDHDLQRLLYWNFFKCYWNENLSFEENNAVNFDWFSPVYCHRHTPEEVEGWLRDLHLVPLRFYVNQSGISVIARKASPA